MRGNRHATDIRYPVTVSRLVIRSGIMPPPAKYPLPVRQSPAFDTSAELDETWIRNKTVVVTGGASGFGEGFFRRWAADGATVVIGDINIRRGDQLVREVRKGTGNPNLHFFHCDVTDWQSQVQFFKDAIRVSPHGGIDTVVANAGIVDLAPTIETPRGLDTPNPSPPNLSVLDVNLKGVLYTSHLALFHLAKNPFSAPADPDCDPTKTFRDRHLLLMSSMAGIAPIPYQTLYATSKHAVVGLYRNLRCSSYLHGVRTNLICPYFMYVHSRILQSVNIKHRIARHAFEAAAPLVSQARRCLEKAVLTLELQGIRPYSQQQVELFLLVGQWETPRTLLRPQRVS